MRTALFLRFFFLSLASSVFIRWQYSNEVSPFAQLLRLGVRVPRSRQQQLLLLLLLLLLQQQFKDI